ncbi:2-dehydro-3-deoxygluconokinase [Streptomyces sp. RB5]|uniref:2-dehydro-3-deoxygluconokinase n=1 Tax=Streptomyces smaragdinus TaxID=2585196 RepID=A0A7K0CP80_9ACTN|nr:sugar kinase [Streptomyces smaragdinus]MQY14832.1 2-dehydro-3-deoxygluconokinase [Streptomyces smaragdinus]
MYDAVCLGETMAAFAPTDDGPLSGVAGFTRGLGGAESNVACALAAAGHRTAWVSRLGGDGFGDFVRDAVAAYGVDVSYVVRDPDRPTGVYFRTAAERAHAEGAPAEVAYYRRGSAASALAPGAELPPSRVLHLTGITPALSPTCLALARELTVRRPGRPLVSFDVNHRPALWPAEEAGPVLAELARGADLVFVGADEAAALWGTARPEDIRAALPGPATVVVKQGADGATALTARGVTHVAAHEVDVVAYVGAGDAFAAGYLDATLTGRPAADALRRGHDYAARVLATAADLAPPPGVPA